MPRPPIHLRQTIKAAHLVLMGYGHWLPNDPRGSRSDEVRSEPLRNLGEPHVGRKAVQPSRAELKAFYRKAEAMLVHDTVWFDAAMRSTIAEGVAQAVKERGYTLWALAVMRNHLHAVVRTHRDDSETIMAQIALRTQRALWEGKMVPKNHPVWADGPWKVFLTTPAEIRGRIEYVRQNPMKEGLPEQSWGCVVPYRG
jgi:REP element-mobilizing transposase RayT